MRSPLPPLFEGTVMGGFVGSTEAAGSSRRSRMPEVPWLLVTGGAAGETGTGVRADEGAGAGEIGGGSGMPSSTGRPLGSTGT